MAVSYTILSNDRTDEGKSRVQARISYAAEAYSAGLPVSGPSLGMATSLESLFVESAEANEATIIKFDKATNKIRIYEETTGTFAEVSGNQTLDVVVVATGW